MSHPLTLERRKYDRRSLAYFMMATEPGSQEIFGQLLDLTPTGFLMDSPRPFPPGQDVVLEVDAAPDRPQQTPLCFTARARWCRPDSIEPSLYNIGFEITEIDPEDKDILRETAQKYTVQEDLPLS